MEDQTQFNDRDKNRGGMEERRRNKVIHKHVDHRLN